MITNIITTIFSSTLIINIIVISTIIIIRAMNTIILIFIIIIIISIDIIVIIIIMSSRITSIINITLEKTKRTEQVYAQNNTKYDKMIVKRMQLHTITLNTYNDIQCQTYTKI